MKKRSSFIGAGSIFLLACALSLVALAANPQKPAAKQEKAATAAAVKVVPPASTPEAVVEETDFDAGTVTRGDTITHDFVVNNEGKGTLEVTRVQPTCGCTVTKFDRTIAPGKTGKITASVHTAAFSGPIHKTIMVATNDPKMANFQLSIKAVVKSILNVSPQENQNFGLVFKGQSMEKTFDIKSSDGKPFEITSVQAQDNNLKYDLSQAKDHQSAVFKVMLPADHPVGPINGRFTLMTTHPKVHTLNLNVFGTIRDPLTVYPQDIVFTGLNKDYINAHPDDISLNKTITLAYEQGPGLKIEKVTSSLKNLEATVQTITPNQRYSIRLHLKPPVELGDFSGEVTVKTNKKTVTIPVRGKIF